MRIVLVHPADPSSPTEGGTVRYSLNILEYLLKNDIDTTLLGVQSGEQTFAHSKFTFVPILKRSDSWQKYFAKLMLKVPFLNIPDSAVIHTFRLDFTLPFVLF